MECFGTYFTHVQKALLWTWQRAHMEHTKYTAVRTKVYIQQNHSACTDEALGRVYKWGPWPRVQTRPLPLRPWPEPSACTCDPGPEPSACTCDPRKRVHSRPPDPNTKRLLNCKWIFRYHAFQFQNHMYLNWFCWFYRFTWFIQVMHEFFQQEPLPPYGDQPVFNPRSS